MSSPQGKTESSTSTSVNYGIDVVGNQTTDGRKTYGIDASGRFATLSQGTGRDRQSMLYLHNALGQRVFKSEFTSEDYEPSEEDLGKDYVTWLRSRFGWMFAAKKDERMKLGTAYVYDEDGNIMGETGNGGARSNGTTDYIWLPTPAGTSVLVGAVVNGNSYAVHTDHLGTPRRLTNAQNKPAWQLAYSAFGDNAPTTAQNHFKPTATMSEGEDKKAALTFNLRFPGQYFDAESGLSYNYFRTYDAKTGRYTQSDPIGLNGGWNRFSYVEGNPLSKSDPLGLQSDARPNRPGWPDFMQPTQPNRSCATAECAAGLLPAPSENRTQKEVDYGQCKLVCQISLAVPVAACNAAFGGGLPGTAAGAVAKAGLCTWVCK